jgi:hypothetical protein
MSISGPDGVGVGEAIGVKETSRPAAAAVPSAGPTITTSFDGTANFDWRRSNLASS